MSINNLDTLSAVIKDYTALRSQVFTNQIPTFVSMAEERIYNGSEDPLRSDPVRVNEMIVVDEEIEVVDGVASTPANFLGFISAYWDSDPANCLSYISPRSYGTLPTQRYAGTGFAGWITVIGNKIKVSPMETGVIVASYYVKPTALVEGGDSNLVLVNYPIVYLQACLVESHGFVRDQEEVAASFQRYSSAARAANMRSKMTVTGGVSLQPVMGGIA